MVFECPVPASLRRAALNDELEVRIAPHKNLEGAYPKLPLLVQRSVKWPDNGPKIGACAWVKGGAYHDRDGNLLGLPAARVAEWLAHLRVLGVGHVLITDNSDNVFAKALRGESARETSPLTRSLMLHQLLHRLSQHRPQRISPTWPKCFEKWRRRTLGKWQR